MVIIFGTIAGILWMIPDLTKNLPENSSQQDNRQELSNSQPVENSQTNQNYEQYQNPDLNQSKQEYKNAVANINSVWNNLHPSTREFFTKEQIALNKKREADCIAYGKSQSTDKNLAKAYRYLCEVPRLNERTEYLKSQLGVVKYVEKPLPQTGATNNPNLQGVAPLEIKTSIGSHYWVKIVHLDGSELASFFIRGGDILEIKVPAGSYEVKYATGNTWYGNEYLFGDETQYSKADKVFNFEFNGYSYSGYTIELIRQINGNLSTSHIDANQF